MQLKNRISGSSVTSLRKSLSAATGALLGGVAPAAHAFGSDWKFDAAVLHYSESDNRVEAIEPAIKARTELSDDEFLDLKLVVDSLTGATPTGAVPSSRAQTFTRPSGQGSYTVPANEVPLDDTFHDTRWQISAGWERPVGRLSKITYGANVSNEYDFQSLGVNATFAHDFNQRNTTLSAGLSFEADEIKPEGGIPVELSSVMSFVGDADDEDENESEDDNDGADLSASESRDQVDLLLGLTQVIGPRTVMQFNLSLSSSSGYHNDPFKFISIVDDQPGANLGEPIDNIYEKRPDSRMKNSFYWKTKHSFNRDVIDVSYRYMTDDWGIDSHTLDLHYTWMLDSGSYWQPHLRYYQQNAADFYRTLLPASEPIPAEVSADYRLGDLNSITVGLKYSYLLENEHRMEFRVEMLSQTNDPSPGSKIGSQANRPIILDTDALIAQFTYSF